MTRLVLSDPSEARCPDAWHEWARTGVQYGCPCGHAHYNQRCLADCECDEMPPMGAACPTCNGSVLRSSFVTWTGKLEIPCPNHSDRLFQGGVCTCSFGYKQPKEGNAWGYVAPSPGDTYTDVEIVEMGESDGSNGNGSPWVKRNLVPLGVAGSVHVIGRDKVERAENRTAPKFYDEPDSFLFGVLALPPDLFDAIPSDVPWVLYVTETRPT